MLFRALNRFPLFTCKQSGQGYFFSCATVNSRLSLAQSLILTCPPLQIKLHLPLDCKQNKNTSLWSSGALNWIKSSTFFQLYKYIISSVRKKNRQGRLVESMLGLCRKSCRSSTHRNAVQSSPSVSGYHQPSHFISVSAQSWEGLWQPWVREAGAAADPGLEWQQTRCQMDQERESGHGTKNGGTLNHRTFTGKVHQQ